MNEALACCNVCPHRCVLAAGQTGPCQARMGWDGQSVSLYEGWATVVHDDPIEKKYLHHFCPGATVRTLGFGGCSLRCSFCQNATLSHTPFAPEHHLADLRLGEAEGVAFSYNEPTLAWENVCRVGQTALDRGRFVVLNTNGY